MGGRDVRPLRKPERPAAIDCYLRRLREETAKLQLIGLGEDMRIELEIDQAYVPLRAVISQSMIGK